MNNSVTDSSKPDKPFQQRLENLPDEIRNQPRYFEVGADKMPHVKDWSNPKNQKHYTEIQGYAGFDTTGHDVADDYLFLDFDHIFRDGQFVNVLAEEWFNKIHDALKTYCELSISRAGAHMIACPTKGKIKSVASGKSGRIDFGDGACLEIFYKTRGRYCLFTGDVYQCAPKAPVTHGQAVDDVLQTLLDKITKQNQKPLRPPARSEGQSTELIYSSADARKKNSSKLGIEYDLFRAEIMLDAINPADLSDSDWLAVMSACKNIGVPYAVVDAFNLKDPDRYNEQENLKRWDSVSDPSFDIATLHGIAKRFGYDEKAAMRDYYKLHPELTTEISHRPAQASDDEDRPMGESKKIFSDDEIKFYLYQPYTDLGFARRIKKFSANSIRWLTDDEKWAIYKPAGFWQITSEKNSAILPVVNRLADKLRATAQAKEKSKAPIPDYLKTYETNENIAQKLKNISVKLSLSKNSNPAIFYLKGESDLLISRQDLDNHIFLLNCKNGVVDLQNGKIYGHAPDLLLTQQINFPYSPDFHSELVDNFFSSILPDEDTREAVLLWLGYCLTGDISMQCAHFWTGQGSNGKSTLLDWLLFVFGAFGVKLSVKAIVRCRDSEANAATTHLNPLIGARLAVVDEFEPYHRLNEQIFKALTGDKHISIRQLHHEREVIENKAKLILNGNKLPNLDNSESYAIRRRIRAVDYQQVFSEAKGNLNPDLPKQLRDTHACTALLSILVSKAIEWYKSGKLIETSAMTTAKTDYLNENDFVEEFISENCIFSPDAVARRKDFETLLKEAFPCETAPARIRPRDLSALIRTKLESHGVAERKGTHNENLFQGVELIGAFHGKPIDTKREAIP